MVLKTLFLSTTSWLKTRQGTELLPALKQFLSELILSLPKTPTSTAQRVFLERLDPLLDAEDVSIRVATASWFVEGLMRIPCEIPSWLHSPLLARLQQVHQPQMASILLAWLTSAAPVFEAGILAWLASLRFETPEARNAVICALLDRFLTARSPSHELVDCLLKMDKPTGAVVDVALQRFPVKQEEDNRRLIHLMGASGRFRVVRPLVSFAREFPEYLRPVMKALSHFEYAEVNAFYFSCLSSPENTDPMALIDAIKQVRKRKLKKAVPQLAQLFPYENSHLSLVNRTVNNEVALTMGAFGVYAWGRECLLPDIILNGVTLDYLKVIDRLNLEEAVPYLKALLLMPETTEIVMLQDMAYRICERLLMLRQAVNSTSLD